MKNLQPFPEIAFEQEVSSRAAFLRQNGLEERIESGSIVVLRNKVPEWTFTFSGNGLKVSFSVTWPDLLTTIICKSGDEYFLFDHYLTFIKKDDIKKLYHEFFVSALPQAPCVDHSLLISQSDYVVG